MDPIRFGIIGCSRVARNRFLPAVTSSMLAQLERVGSRDESKAEEYARAFSCAKHGSYEAVLADPDVEIVYISTPPTLHGEWVLRAAASGKHVLCEKPAFPSLRAASDAVERCRAAGVRLFEAYAFRHHPQHARVRSLIAQQRIGEPRFFHAEFTYPRPPEGDIRLQPSLGGGVLHDSGGYPVAAALHLMFGVPVSVFCQLGLDHATGVDNAFMLSLVFSTGAMAQMLVAFGTHYRSRYAVMGTRGRIELHRAFSVTPQMGTFLLLETETGEENIALEPADQFRLMVDMVAAQIRGADARHDSEGELLRQHAVMDAAVRSIQEGRLIPLAGVPR